MINMSLDIAKGCSHLEEIHFVHRDIAARNCLISSKDPATRVVPNLTDSTYDELFSHPAITNFCFHKFIFFQALNNP
jgi:serine/threonine protein kinase